MDAAAKDFDTSHTSLRSSSKGQHESRTTMYESAPSGYTSSNPQAPVKATSPRNLFRKGGALRRIRDTIREPFAEFLGVLVLIVFGNGVNAQVVLSGNPGVAASSAGGYLSINIGWGIGTAMGVWISAGISGGHINPAVTLALATFRGFPWRKVPAFIFAQLLGGMCGAGIIYANYYHAINIVEGGAHMRTALTRGLFSTYAAEYLTNVSAFFDEFLGTAILMLLVLAFGDKKNCPVPAGLAPLALFLLVTGIGTSLGFQTGYAINPARDLGPRIFSAMAGYGKDVFTFRNQYWIWCPVLAPILGALVGTVVYDTFLFDSTQDQEDSSSETSSDITEKRVLSGDERV